MPQDSFISLRNLTRKFGAMTAVDGLNLEIARGEVFGLVGPDGAGKTTLFRILTTLLLADEGSASVDGLDVVKDFKAIRKTVGYMPGRFSLYQDLSVEENLNFFATIFNTTIKDNYDLIKDIYSQIEPFKKRRAGALSGGMKQKLALSCALIHRPSVLFLDEPTTGVDAVSRKEFWDMLKNLKQQGITILVSTPYMDEAAMCDRVALIQLGKILSINTPQKIVEEFGKPLYSVKSDKMLYVLKALQQFEGTEDVYPFGDVHHLILKNSYTSTSAEKYLHDKNLTATITETMPNIEDCFISLMKNND